MKKISFVMLSCVLLHLITINCFGQNFQKQIDSMLAHEFPAGEPGAAVQVAKADTIIYEKAFGLANLELNVSLKPNDIFRIGSITKQFTACAILRLAEQGRLSLNDSITKFIKGYPEQGVTIEHLLTHTSGINNGAGDWTPELRKKDLTPLELINLFKDKPLDFLPSTRFSYNNNGYILLGYIIEIVSGMPYGKYITENIFKPLGMKHTFYDNSSTIIPGRVNGYRKDDDRYINADFLSMTQPYSAGSMLSTVGDLYIWNKALINYKVISKQSLEKAQTSFKLNDGTPTGYGFGWWLGTIKGSPDIKHDGAINGFSTFSVYLPQEKIFVAIFSNRENLNLEVNASKIAAIVMDKPYYTNKNKLPEDKLRSYTGVYHSQTGTQKMVSYEDGRLLYFSKGGGKEEMIAFGDDRFYFENSLAIIHFERSRHDSTIMMIQEEDKQDTFMLTNIKLNVLRPITISTQMLEKYIGQYKFADGFVLSIIKDGNKLYGKGTGPRQVRQEILPYSENKFFAKNLDAQLQFKVDENGTVTGLVKKQGGESVATKIE